MSDFDNPYRPPSQPINLNKSYSRFTTPAAQRPAGAGMSWITDSWALFKSYPLMWGAAAIIFVTISCMVQLIPVLGSIAGVLIGPALAVGMLCFADTIRHDNKADLSQLFAGFQSEKIGSLLILGLLSFGLMMALMFIGILGFVLLVGVSALQQGANALPQLLSGGVSLTLLIGFLFILLMMAIAISAYWFAPALVFYTSLSPVDALKESMSCCMRNWLPLSVYGIVATLILLVSVIPLGLGLLVTIPWLMASCYTCFCGLYEDVIEGS